MIRLQALNPDEATGKTKDLFDGVKRQLGMVPNMMRTMGHSPALLEGTLNLSAALGTGTLGAKTGLLIAMAVAESNGCDYCLGAHGYVGDNFLKMDTKALEAARHAEAIDPKTEAILKFAKTLVDKRGRVNDTDVEAVKTAGVSDAQIAEIVGHVALNTLTNYFNNTANTELDFPKVETHGAVAA